MPSLRRPVTLSERSPWWVVAGVFLVLMVSSGFGFYNLSVYMNALADERSFAVGELSGAIAVMFVVSGVSGMGVARLMERVDVRWVMVAGAAIAGASLAAVGAAQEIWHVWLLYALFGIGNSGISLIPGTTLVTRWFPGANRSVALSVASTGLSTGGIVLTPACASVIHHLGIGAAMPWFGAVQFLVIVPIALWLVRSWPDETRAEARPLPGESVRSALGSRFFLATTAAYVLILGTQVGAIAHLFNHVQRMTDHVVASLAVSVMAGVSIVGRLLGGVVVTTFPILAFTLINVAGQSLGMVALAYADSEVTALAGAAVFGITVGNLLMLQPLIVVQAFGVGGYPRLYAVANAATTLGVAGGPLAMGLLHDAFDYRVAFLAAALMSGVAFFVFLVGGGLPSAQRLGDVSRR